MKTDIYTQKGKKAGSIELPESVFAVPMNKVLVHQVVVSMKANERTPIAHAKDRSEVSGGGKKPWKQKGTGRARHGSSRSPIWVGGGVAHGPKKDKDYSKKINKKMRNKALASVLSAKLSDGKLVFLDTLAFDAPSTKDAKEVLAALSGIKGCESLATRRKNAVLVTVKNKDEAVYKSFQNFGNVVVTETRNLNPVDVMHYMYVVIADADDAVKTLSARMGAEKAADNS